MAEIRFLRKASASGSSPTLASAASAMPPELLAEASRRLGWAGLIYACTFTVAYFGPHIYASLTEPDHRYSGLRDSMAIGAIALGVAVFVLSRRARVRAQALLDFGLVFSVVGSLGIAIAEFSRGYVAQPRVLGDYLGVPWECVWIILFPLFAPNQPRRILIASLASASMGPLTLLVIGTMGGVELHASATSIAIYFLFSTYLCAGLAYVMSAVIMKYGARLKKARDVGSYQLVELIGSGGMGDVWVGWHQMLARPAAIKLIRAEVLGADRRSRETVCKRFEREAQATAALGSAHTVDVYDFGVTDEGNFFYVMELLEGVTLDQLVKRFGPVEPTRVVHLLCQVCHSLSEAHDQGLIHRDIKPANIFTCRVGPDYDFVKVLDFGLVKANADVPHVPELTHDGLTTGTPAYMAPEMALGQLGDGRADLYSVGCVGYWLLTGTHVFDGENAVATLLRHVSEEPVPPSQRIAQPIPAALEAVVLACLAKSPAERPQTAAELARLLTSAVAGDSWTSARARDWWETHQPRRRTPRRPAADTPASATTRRPDPQPASPLSH
jgi:serine/threonine-protein kinase